MTRPRPSPLNGVPAGVTSLSGPVEWFAAAFHVTSESLDPDEVTRLMGIRPTESQRKGVPIQRADGSTKRIPKFGRWTIRLKPTDSDEWDIEELVKELLAPLPEDERVWKAAANLGSLRISLGLAITRDGQGYDLQPEALRLLGGRGISIGFDLYRGDLPDGIDQAERSSE